MIDLDWPLDREELAHENDFDFLGNPQLSTNRWNLRGHEDDILDEEIPHTRCWHCGTDLIVNPGVLVLVSKKDADSTIMPLYYCRDCYEVRGDRIKAATVADFMI